MTYLNCSCFFTLVKQNLCDQVAGKEMVIWPRANNLAVMTNVGAGAGLILKVQRQSSIEGTVRISGIRLRI